MKIDFEQLEQTKQQTNQINNIRSVESLKCYDKGQRILSTAFVKKYDKALLQEAGDIFVQGISLDKKEPQNYLGLAYLLLLANQPKEAVNTLKAALFLEPQNNMGLHLMSKAEQALSKPHAQSMNIHVPSIDLSHKAIDYDQLYDQVELDILNKVIDVMENQTIPVNPSINQQIIQQLVNKKVDLEVVYHHIEDRLSIVEQEIDTSDLRQQLKPIEIRLKQLLTAIEVSEQFLELQTTLSNQIKWTHMSISQLTIKMLPVMEKKVEEFIDRCDKIADKLDEIESQGFNISEIEPIYNNFVKSIEILQHELDNFDANI